MDPFAPNTTVRCRAHARECRDLAGRAASDDERALLIELAVRWDALADILERHGALGETP